MLWHANNMIRTFKRSDEALSRQHERLSQWTLLSSLYVGVVYCGVLGDVSGVWTVMCCCSDRGRSLASSFMTAAVWRWTCTGSSCCTRNSNTKTFCPRYGPRDWPHCTTEARSARCSSTTLQSTLIFLWVEREVIWFFFSSGSQEKSWYTEMIFHLIIFTVMMFNLFVTTGANRAERLGVREARFMMFVFCTVYGREICYYRFTDIRLQWLKVGWPSISPHWKWPRGVYHLPLHSWSDASLWYISKNDESLLLSRSWPRLALMKNAVRVELQPSVHHSFPVQFRDFSNLTVCK